MNIPLDNLYHWVRGCAVEPLSIYIFSPHGSKNITDLSFLTKDDKVAVAPELICHDQEPLNYERWQNVKFLDLWNHIKNLKNSIIDPEKSNDELQLHANIYDDLNFYTMTRVLNFRSIFDRYILLHSEKNSLDVEKFSNFAEPVFYWAHGIIARDWYRFADHDPRLQLPAAHKKTFLVYCRAWTGTREYRLKFLELLVDNNLIEHCDTSIMRQDQEFNLNSYVCKNSNLQPNDIAKLANIKENTHSACASADYCVEDFASTYISVVLETIADDSKIHLTEKILRPIACGHPFMLVAGPKSLEYLKSYGFKTFDLWIDESYDQESDIVKRMEMIVKEMKRINNMSAVEKKQMLVELKKITEYNKKHFFSNIFFNQIQSELVENLNQAVAKVKFTRGSRFLAARKIVKIYRRLQNRHQVNYAISILLRKLRQNPNLDLKQAISQSPVNLFNP
jgi:hypothetical protein